MLIDKIKHKIDKAEIVSFDIFDTLLIRPYVKPIDLFKHLSYLHKKEYFYEERIEAERKARQYYANTQEDITIDQIYEFMPQKMKSLKYDEIELEKQVLTINKEIKEIFDYAILNDKKVIISSDMYLPKKVLVDILNSKGYNRFSELYVSGEFGKSKYTGTLYKYILNHYNINPDKILHIGDNIQSDYEMPKSFGIESILYKKAIDKLFEINERAKIFIENHSESLGASIILGQSAICIINNDIDYTNNYWQYFGIVYGGAVCLSYMKWINKQVKENNIKNLLFVARDGYILKKVYDVINTLNINTNYIYAPRNLSLACTLDYKKRVNASCYEAVNTLQSIANTYCKEKQIPPVKITNIKAGLTFIKQYQTDLENIALKYTDEYMAYLTKFVAINTKIAVVDTITTFFAAQKLIEHTLKKPVMGFYWVSNLYFYRDAENYFDFKSFDKTNSLRINGWEIMEFIMTSPEAPISKLENGKPVYKENITFQEKIRMNIYPDIEKGIMEFVKNSKLIFNDNNLFITNDDITDWINLFCNVPTNFEKNIFSKLGFALDATHEDYVSIPSNWFKSQSKISFLEQLFSIKNNSDKKHKIIRILGLKIKIKRNKK